MLSCRALTCLWNIRHEVEAEAVIVVCGPFGPCQLAYPYQYQCPRPRSYPHSYQRSLHPTSNPNLLPLNGLPNPLILQPSNRKALHNPLAPLIGGAFTIRPRPRSRPRISSIEPLGQGSRLVTANQGIGHTIPSHAASCQTHTLQIESQESKTPLPWDPRSSPLHYGVCASTRRRGRDAA